MTLTFTLADLLAALGLIVAIRVALHIWRARRSP